MEITKEQINKLKQNDRLELYLELIIEQGKSNLNSIWAYCALIVVGIVSLIIPILATFFFMIIVIRFLLVRKKQVNEINKVLDRYFVIKTKEKKNG